MCVCARVHLIETCGNSGCIEIPVDLCEVELGCVPAADAVVGAEVPLVGTKPVRGRLVPLGKHVHVVALLVAQPGDAALDCYVTLG